jgi:hypothetical protein
VGRRRKLATQDEAAPEDFPEPHRRPSNKTAKSGSIQSSAKDDTAENAQLRSIPKPARDTNEDVSPQLSAPDDAIQRDDPCPAANTALGDTDQTFATEEANGDEDSAHSPGPGEDTTEGEDADGGTPPSSLPEASPLKRFVDEACVVSSDQAAPARDLYIAYLRWCDENRVKPWRQRNFGLALTGLGFRRRRRGQGRHWWMGFAVGSAPFSSI